MQLFRRLSGNIIFKIILAFVALSFVLFGVSSFILGSPNAWVAKVGSTTISYSAFTKALQSDREMILASNKSEDAMRYLDSDQFKSDVLGRMVNAIMIEKLHDRMGVEASKKLILQSVAKDPSFKNKDGKFDRAAFRNFLAKNGLNEEKYVKEISNDVVATMILQTMAMSAPINPAAVVETENFKQEKRFADVVTISEKNVSSPAKISDEEIQKFYEANKSRYVLPEMRKVSYIAFSKKDFVKDLKVTDAEIAAEYEKNQAQFMRPESRDFYHILFDKNDDAQKFLQKFEANKTAGSNASEAFLKVAKEDQKKDLKGVSLNKITAKDLIPELSEPTFKLAKGQNSDVLSSPLGYHVFLVVEVRQPQQIPLAEVKESIRHQLYQGREDKVLQAKISEIDDTLLTSNSLAETAKKFGFKVGGPVRIDQAGQNAKGEQVNEAKVFGNFSENAFALKKGQASKIFYAKVSEGFYAIQIDEIEPSHQMELAEVKAQVIDDLSKHNRSEALQNLAKKVGDEIRANPEKAAEIAGKYKVKFEKGKEFPRIYFISFQGRQVPYQNKFLEELFNLKTGEATSVLPGGSQEFVVGVLRNVKKSEANPAQLAEAYTQASENFKAEILQEYNRLLLKENPVKVNEKILGKKESEAKSNEL